MFLPYAGGSATLERHLVFSTGSRKGLCGGDDVFHDQNPVNAYLKLHELFVAVPWALDFQDEGANSSWAWAH